MNILLFIYIFSLFVITTPNVLFKIPGKCGLGVTMLHAFVFTFILYFTYDTVSISIVEGSQFIGTVSGLNTTTDDVDENSDTAAKTALDAATAKTALDAANNAAKEAEDAKLNANTKLDVKSNEYVNKNALRYVQDTYRNELDNAYTIADTDAKRKEATRDNNPNKYQKGAFGASFPTQVYSSQIIDADAARNYANILKTPKDLADALKKASTSVLQAADGVSTSAKSVASYAESILKLTTPAERAATIKDKASAAKTIADTAKSDADKVVTDADKAMTDATTKIAEKNALGLNESKNLSYHLLAAAKSVAEAALKVSTAAKSVTEATTSFK